MTTSSASGRPATSDLGEGDRGQARPRSPRSRGPGRPSPAGRPAVGAAGERLQRPRDAPRAPARRRWPARRAGSPRRRGRPGAARSRRGTAGAPRARTWAALAWRPARASGVSARRACRPAPGRRPARGGAPPARAPCSRRGRARTRPPARRARSRRCAPATASAKPSTLGASLERRLPQARELQRDHGPVGPRAPAATGLQKPASSGKRVEQHEGSRARPTLPGVPAGRDAEGGRGATVCP